MVSCARQGWKARGRKPEHAEDDPRQRAAATGTVVASTTAGTCTIAAAGTRNTAGGGAAVARHAAYTGSKSELVRVSSSHRWHA